MEIEIKLKCSICETWLNGGQRLETPDTLIFVQPCPNCHPAKVDKVTPKEGELIEVAMENYPSHFYNVRESTGCRKGGQVQTDSMIGYSKTTMWPKWRHPGETEWRD